MDDVKEAINQAPDSAEAYLLSLAHKYAKKACQEAKKLVKAAKLEESEAKTLEDAVFENFKKVLSHVSLHKPTCLFLVSQFFMFKFFIEGFNLKLDFFFFFFAANTTG